MRFSWIFLIIAPLLSCTREATTENKKIKSDVQFSKFEGKEVLLCLERNLLFIKYRPQTLKEFILKTSKYSLICDASNDDLKAYVEMIIDQHGSKL